MYVLILNVVVGAVIGLFTNWIAIVMLFRPWEEKRLFGRRLPLTPGLIPRRQHDLADKLGEVVERDLLTPEGVAKSLKRPALEFAFKKAAVRTIGDTLHAAPTVLELFEKAFGTGAAERIEHFAVDRVVALIQSEEGRIRIEQWADALFDHLRHTLGETEIRRGLVRGIASPLHTSVSQGTLLWREALPEGARELIEERLKAQIDPLVEKASGWLEEEAAVNAIGKLLLEKVESIPLIGAMAKGFVTPDRVRGDIVPRLQEVVRSQTVRDLISDKVHHQLLAFWERPVGQMLGKLSEDDLSDLLDKLLAGFLERVMAEGSSTRDTFRTMLVNGLTAGGQTATIRDLVRRLLDRVLSFEVRDWYIKRTETADRYLTTVWRYLRDQLIDALPEILDALSFSQIVKERVASFPIPTLEKLILSVVNKELRLITILGGVLGAVIGLVQGMLSNFHP